MIELSRENRVSRVSRGKRWELPDPFAPGVEKIVQTVIWAYVGLAVLMTIVHNIIH
ncbi:MAG: hypothetical protein Q7T82_11285 [Armatimonadota bacterium]|nr:hypothetical protein [Armatimonadota bacterium]